MGIWKERAKDYAEGQNGDDIVRKREIRKGIRWEFGKKEQKIKQKIRTETTYLEREK